MPTISEKISGDRDFYQERMLTKLDLIENACKKIRKQAEHNGMGFPSEDFSNVATLAAQAGGYAAKYEAIRDVLILDN